MSASRAARDFTHLMSEGALADGGGAGGGEGGGGDGGGEGGGEGEEGAAQAPPAEKANFAVTGALAEDVETGNTYNGVELKWSEPAEARQPAHRWRLYVFKNDEQIGEPLHLHRQSAYLVGRDKRVADLRVDHPSCSKQHAVIQYRYVEEGRGAELAHLDAKHVVKPYVMDLESTHGTFINGDQIDGARYYELKPQVRMCVCVCVCGSSGVQLPVVYSVGACFRCHSVSVLSM